MSVQCFLLYPRDASSFLSFVLKCLIAFALWKLWISVYLYSLLDFALTFQLGKKKPKCCPLISFFYLVEMCHNHSLFWPFKLWLFLGEMERFPAKKWRDLTCTFIFFHFITYFIFSYIHNKRIIFNSNYNNQRYCSTIMYSYTIRRLSSYSNI